MKKVTLFGGIIKFRATLLLFLGFLISLSTYSQTCPTVQSNGVFDPNADVLITSYHQSMAKTASGDYVVWGEDMTSDGSTDATSLTLVTSANGFNFTGTVRHYAISGNSGGQAFLATTTKLYAWGLSGEVVDGDFVTGNSFAEMKNVPFTGAEVKDMHASSDVLFVTLNSGVVWVATTGATAPNGNASTDSSIWHKVKINATTDLTNVKQVTGSFVAGYALLNNGDIYAWGDNVELGNGGGTQNLTYATKMIAPPATISYISAIFNDGASSGLLALGTDKKVYGVGDSTSSSIINTATGNVNTWTAIQISSGVDLTGVIYLATSHTSEQYAGAAVIVEGNGASNNKGILYSWGDDGSGYDALAHPGDVDYPTIPSSFTVGSDDPSAVSVGGHAITYFNRTSGSICFAGHITNGSTGGLTTGSGENFECVIPTGIELCALQQTITANDDSGTHPLGTNGTAVANVLSNDELNGSTGPTAVTDVTVSQVSTTNAGVTINSSGQVNVTSSVPLGTYTLVYEICEVGVTYTNCSIATVTIDVINDDDGDGIDDADDLDSDNDGILDTDEGRCTPTTVTGDDGFSASVNSGDIDDEELAVDGINGDYAKFNNNNASIDIVLRSGSALVSAGTDITITAYKRNNGANNMRIEESTDGITFGNAQVYTFATRRTYYDKIYTLTTDATHIRITFIRVSSHLRVDNVSYEDFTIPCNTSTDTDSDGIPDYLDLDSDNDGIPDVIEAGGTDANRDGMADGVAGTTPTTNGVPSSAGTGLTLVDSDNDGIPNHLDIDADNDGIPDNIEGQSSSGYIPPSGVATGITDANNNGVDDNYESGAIIGLNPPDTDSDGTLDYLDSDSDNDGILDIEENGDANNTLAGSDTDGDGLDDNFDDNDDSSITGFTVNDGVGAGDKITNTTNLKAAFGDEDNNFPGTGDLDYRDFKDSDDDGIADFYDLDDDNDGILDVDESYNCTLVSSMNTVAVNIINGNTQSLTLNGEKGFGFDVVLLDNSFSITVNGVQLAINGTSPYINDFNFQSPHNVQFTDGDRYGVGGVSEVWNLSEANPSTPIIRFLYNANDETLEMYGSKTTNGVLQPMELIGGLTLNSIPWNTTSSNTIVIGQAVVGPTNLKGTIYGVNLVTPCTDIDTDGDGIPNRLDLDSDNDGITDVIEAGGTDVDNDGKADGAVGTSSTTNGIPSSAGTGLTIIDTDSDDIPDFLDIDSDNDGIPDNVEAQSSRGYILPSGVGTSMTDANNNGVDDNYENGAIVGLTPIDFDGDTTPDYLDSDSDNDAINDISENGNVNNTLSGTDTDGDGLDDNFDDVDDSSISGSTVNDNHNPPSVSTLGDDDSDYNTIGDFDYRDTGANGTPMITQVYQFNNERWIEVTNISATLSIPANLIKIQLFKNKTGAQTDVTPDVTHTVTTSLAPGKSILFKSSSNIITNLDASATVIANNSLTDIADANDIITLSSENEGIAYNFRYDVVETFSDKTSYVRIDETLVPNKTYAASEWVVFIDDALDPYRALGSGGPERHPHDPLISEIINSNADANTLLGLHRVNITTRTGGEWSNGYPDRSRFVVVDQDYNHSGNRLSARKLTVNASRKLAVTENLLVVTNDVLLNGEIRLIDDSGESKAQFIQTHTGTSKVTGSGKLLVDQNSAVPSLYRYNYMSSPVKTNSGSSNYTVASVFKDGTTETNYSGIVNTNIAKDITFISGYDGNTTDPISLAEYWIYTYAANGGTRAGWAHKSSTDSIPNTDGFIFKGPGRAQNYTFAGIPKGGSFTTSFGGDETYLVGNPFTSALSVKKFIEDNINSITGTLYFWQHVDEDDTSTASSGHNFRGYIGGYATRNIAMGVAANQGTNVSDNGNNGTSGALGSGYIVPLPYVAIGQGFFVSADSNGGDIVFNNSQREFIAEDGPGTSVFFKGATVSKTKETEATLPILKLGMDYANEDGLDFHRQIGISFSETNTFGFDKGYDSEIYDLGVTDIYWKIPESDLKYVIAGVPDISDDLEVPLEIIIDYDGTVEIQIDEMKNIDRVVYLKDKLTNKDYLLDNVNRAAIQLTKGTHSDRFYLTFNGKILSVDDVDVLIKDLSVFIDNTSDEIVIKNIENLKIDKVEMFNILGQRISQWKNIDKKEETRLKVNNLSSDIYIIYIQTDKGRFSKKVLYERK
ncbi:T9SS type A sorting domain-containing protein [Polaribacter uvawellassae]|uniref:T9SS type A sorting domain-containing protein n=1 Tax=Polaribacter uvawellassae TaxID=3133495 RepID=UPI00321A04C1